MGDPHADPQASPQHADPHRFGAFLKKTIQEIHVDRRVVGWSAGRHVDHPCGGQISPWPTRKVTDDFIPAEPRKSMEEREQRSKKKTKSKKKGINKEKKDRVIPLERGHFKGKGKLISGEGCS